jgi:hypothetical protein
LLDSGRAYFVGEVGETNGSEGGAEVEVLSWHRIQRFDPVQGRRITENVASDEDLFGTVFDEDSKVGRTFQAEGLSEDFRRLVSEGQAFWVVVTWAREFGSDTLPAGVFLLITLHGFITRIACGAKELADFDVTLPALPAGA